MGCTYHPDRDSVAQCDHCEADLCTSCEVQVESRGTFCHRCMLALSVEEVKSETTRREQDEEDARVGLQKKWRPTYIQWTLSIGALLLLALVGLQLHWSETEVKPKIILDPNQPVELLAGVQAALEDYFLVQGNQYPDSLYDLFPSFLSEEGENRRALRHLNYSPAEREGYLLRIKPGSLTSGEELVATTLGIRPVEEEEQK